MFNCSCSSIIEKNTYNHKLRLISERMDILEKDIQNMKMNFISPIKLKKSNSTKNFVQISTKKTINNINNGPKIFKNSQNTQKKSIKRRNKYNSYNNSCSELKRYNSYFTKKDNLEYEYELRILRRKFQNLKEKNEKMNNKLIYLKNRNENIELSINSYRSYIESNNNNILYGDDDLNEVKNKKDIIYKIKKFCDKYKKDFNFSENYTEANSTLNMLLNLMDIKFAYEQSILEDYFINGINILIGGKNFLDENTISYMNNIITERDKLISINEKYKIIKQYDELFRQISKFENFDIVLNKIINKNILIDERLKLIKDDNKIETNMSKNNKKSLSKVKKKPNVNKFINFNKAKTISNKRAQNAFRTSNQINKRNKYSNSLLSNNNLPSYMSKTINSNKSNLKNKLYFNYSDNYKDNNF